MERTGAEGEEDWEEEDDGDQAEVQRRIERLEREQWLREQVGFMVCSFFAHTHMKEVALMEKYTFEKN